MQRYDIINHLIKVYGYTSYLEIGVAEGECFNKVECEWKEGVEPNCLYPTGSEPGEAELYTYTSDEYFAEIRCQQQYDIIFIDGDHHEGQVIKDIHNSLKHLNDGGAIVLHDCNPPTADHAADEPKVKSRTGDHYLWNGTVWKAYVKMRMLRTDLQCRCVDADWGCGIIQRGESLKPPGQLRAHDISFADFDEDRVAYLNLITVEEFKELYAG